MTPQTSRLCLNWLAIAFLTLQAGCWSANDREVVAYVALDREFSEPILRQFEAQTGIKVLAKYDLESTKTVGLTTAIIQERNRPRCDLFWNNEILHTLRLQKQGLLEAYPRTGMEAWPQNFISPEGYWYGFAARARVLIINTNLVPPNERPASIMDLANPKWAGKAGIAKPLFGTTATHAAVLFSLWGTSRAEEYYTNVLRNCRVLSGNKQVAMDVAAGSLLFGITDTDDAVVELDRGGPVEIVFPDQGSGDAEPGMGTLLIPNTLALIRGSRHSDHARQLMDFLLTVDVETQLASGPSAQIPVNPQVQERTRIRVPENLRLLPANFEQAAERWETAGQFLKRLVSE